MYFKLNKAFFILRIEPELKKVIQVCVALIIKGVMKNIWFTYCNRINIFPWSCIKLKSHHIIYLYDFKNKIDEYTMWNVASEIFVLWNVASTVCVVVKCRLYVAIVFGTPWCNGNKTWPEI